MNISKDNYAVLDTETTIYAKGNAWSARNKLVLVGLRIAGKNRVWPIEYPIEGIVRPYGQALSNLAVELASLSTLVLFNAKFDLAWLARYGVILPSSLRVFDCQLAEFILDYQRTPFPSLDGCLAKYGLGSKSSVVADEYWDKGIDTDCVPLDILTSYLETDLELTDTLYCTQLALVRSGPQEALVSLHMQDLRVLQEMEQNGLLFDWDGMASAAEHVSATIGELDVCIRQSVPVGYQEYFNPDSGDHLSALLYGGSIRHSVGTPYQHTYKGGSKQGQTDLRYRWEDISITFPRLVTPPEGSELKKDGFFSTDEETLKSLKPGAAKVLVEALLQRSGLKKLRSTYYDGLRKTRDKYDWTDGLLHGTFNQCRVITGRLSSANPNQQNFPDELNQFIVSRYVDVVSVPS